MADGKVIIDTQINAQGITKGVKEAQTAVSKFSVSSIAAFAGITLGIGAVVAGLGKLISSALATADRVDKLSQKIGISTKAFQEWDYALSQSGIDIAVLQPAMKTLNDLMVMAEKGSTDAQLAFSKLGLSWQTLSKMNPDERLNTVIAALQQIEDPVTRSNVAVDLLGKAATELNVIFNTSASETKRLKDEAHRLGLVLDDDLIKKGVEAGDAWEDLKKTFSAFANNIVLKVTPALTRLFAALTPGKQMADLKSELNVVNNEIKELKENIKISGTDVGWFGKLFGQKENTNVKFLKEAEERKKAIESQIAAMEKANQVVDEGATGRANFVKQTDEQIAATKALEEQQKQFAKNMAVAIGDGLEGMGEALANGDDAFKGFARSAVSSIAEVVSALGTQLIATGFVNKNYSDVSQGAGLKIMAGVLKAVAGKFENGGIVPGNSPTGDKLLARVNSGELILNKAQQANLASQLTAGSINTNVNIQNYAGADVSVNRDGNDLNIMIEKKMLKVLGTQRAQKVLGTNYGLNKIGIRRGS